MCDAQLSRLCDLLRAERNDAEARVAELEAAIRTHRDTHADTLAYRRDTALYAHVDET